MKSCGECQLFINVGKMIKLKDSSEQIKTLCKNCYTKMTKEQKKQYSFVEGSKIDVAGGFMFGVFGVQGTISGENPSVKKSQEKYGYTQKQMDNFSIDLFDMHTELLDSSRHQAVVDKFEGKINSRHYRKHIENYVQP
jgi:hypothetical protein